MKALKKAILLALALMLVLSCTLVASADGSASITITNARYGETYNVYKMFDLVSHDGEQYSYKVVDAWKTFFESGNPGASYITLSANGNPTWKEGASKSAFAKAAIAWAKDSSHGITVTAGPRTTTKPAEGTEDTYRLVFNGLEPGYYLVDTSLGALCSLNTAETTVEITDKNTVPTVTKQVKEGEAWTNQNTAKIGDTVEFKATINVGEGTKNYVFHDKMEEGLTFIQNSVQVNGAALTDQMQLKTDADKADTDCTFEIIFDDDYIQSLAKGDTIEVTYQATLNKNVKIIEGDNNNAWLKYGEGSSTTKVPTTTKVLTFDLVKYKEEGTAKTKKLLAGAEFELYDAQTGGNKIGLVKRTDGFYRPAVTGETPERIVTTDTAPIHIVGLDNKTYYLEEVAAPAGFNKPTDRFEVNLTGGSNNATKTADFYDGGVQILNNSGALLPSTGGIGTTVFYIIGAVLMAGAVVVLVSKKRMEREG